MLTKTLEQTGIPKFIGWNRGDGEEDGLVRKAVAAAIYPFQLATSPTAIKAYLTTILFLFTSFVLLSISTTAYAFFYYNYIPQTDLEKPIYLQYDLDRYPSADIPLEPSVLISQQPYDVFITLHMPHGPVNKASGNFMLDLSLHGGKMDTVQSTNLDGTNLENSIKPPALHRSRRPAIVPYKSLPASLARKLIYTPLHILTSSNSHDPDSVTLTVPMFEEVEFARGRDNIPTHAKLTVQTQRPSTRLFTAQDSVPIPHLEVYSAKLTFQVRFHGLRYLIFNHRILSFLVFSSIFYGVSISTVAVVWGLLAMFLRSSTSPDDFRLIKSEKQPTIKQEHDISDPLGTATASDHTAQTVKHLSDEEKSDEGLPITTRTSAAGYTPQTSEATSVDSVHAPSHLPPADVSEEQADDEEEESEDEWQQLERLRRRMEKDARERERLMMVERERDSGLGTSLESGGAGVVRRTSAKRGGGR